MIGMFAVFAGRVCTEFRKLRKGYEELNNPDGGPPPLSNEQKIKLIDSLRAKGSFEAAREPLTNTARLNADQISATVPGQTWKFDDNPDRKRSRAFGLPCDKLTGDIANRPVTNAVVFGSTFSENSFKTAANIVRREAAKYGATTQTLLFHESAKRDYDVQGDGYE